MTILAETNAQLTLSPSWPRVRLGPPLPVQADVPLDAPLYPLEWNRQAELVVGERRFALRLVGGLVSRTTSQYVTVYCAQTGERIELPDLIETYKKSKKGNYWYLSCRGIGTWQHADAKEAYRMACLGLLTYVAQKRGAVAA